MEFFEYPGLATTSLFRSWDKKEMNENINWAVTEKIRGESFSCHTDGEDCMFAKKREVSNKEISDFESTSFMSNLREKIVSIFKRVQDLVHLEDKDSADVAQVTVFGEIFGGLYEHREVAPENVTPIQREIQYCPDIRYFGLDIAFRRKKESGELLEPEFIDFYDTIMIFEDFDIPYPATLFKGKMEDALLYSVGFDSTIPKQLGFPPLPLGANKAEGIVLRPLKNMLLKNHDGEMQRVIIKIQGPEFNGARKKTSDRTRTRKKENSERPHNDILNIMLQFTTESRMIDVISKIGLPDTKEIQEVVEEKFIKSVMTDTLARSETEIVWEACNEEQKEAVRKCLERKANDLLMAFAAKTND
eukprot:Seg298.5 transcript_id=Seg298.5/GoldUCD/mRNA.D3Y31 product="RNA-editing ligase 2 mitochondrial" protein_id=Seg298.5/GoldUCD/D3Y31